MFSCLPNMAGWTLPSTPKPSGSFNRFDCAPRIFLRGNYIFGADCDFHIAFTFGAAHLLFGSHHPLSFIFRCHDRMRLSRWYGVSTVMDGFSLLPLVPLICRARLPRRESIAATLRTRPRKDSNSKQPVARRTCRQGV